MPLRRPCLACMLGSAWVQCSSSSTSRGWLLHAAQIRAVTPSAQTGGQRVTWRELRFRDFTLCHVVAPVPAHAVITHARL